MDIRPFQQSDEDQVIKLWKECLLIRPWNDPRKDIARKMQEQPELFLVGVEEGRVIATAMAGYEGHRGHVFYLGVAEAFRRRSIGHQLMNEVERLLKERGCPKINLVVRTTNTEVIDFYKRIGYSVDDVVSLGKRLVDD